MTNSGTAEARASLADLARLAVMGVGAITAVTGVAAAKGREPAPIVFATASPPVQSAGAPSLPAATSTRLEFRYPDRPGVASSREGNRVIENAAPIAFSSSRSAVTVDEARSIAGSRAEPEALPVSLSTRTARKATVRTKAAIDTPPGYATPVVGAPYEIEGKWYVPTHEPDYDEVGVASWYGPGFHGKTSASGEIYDEMAMTAAHPTLPIPSLVRVTNLENGREAIIRINDRGPFIDDRLIDLSRAAAMTLGFHDAGTARVRVTWAGPAPIEPSAALTNVSTVAPSSRSQVAATPVASRLSPPIDKAAPASAALVEDGFFVQAGSFADMANAQSLRAQLEHVGPVGLQAATRNGVEHYRVMIGPWKSREEAGDARKRLRRAGIEGLVVHQGA